jgi:hypothetical protein
MPIAQLSELIENDLPPRGGLEWLLRLPVVPVPRLSSSSLGFLNPF